MPHTSCQHGVGGLMIWAPPTPGLLTVIGVTMNSSVSKVRSSVQTTMISR